MDFKEEINRVIASGLDKFKIYLQEKIQENKEYLAQFFWLQPNGSQMTVLNYLIEEHQESNNVEAESSKDLTKMIEQVVRLTSDKNAGEPLHQAITAGKIQLALHLLALHKAPNTAETEGYFFDINRRDRKGRTILSLTLDSRNSELLKSVLAYPVNIHATTSRTSAQVEFQPIHQAVILNDKESILLLASQHAQLANPVGVMKDTPVLLAARLGKMNALDALLKLPVERLMLEASNNHFFDNSAEKKMGHTAIEEFCEHIANKNNTEEAIRGVAMLLCCGAEPPRTDSMRQLLRSNRVALLKAVHLYLEDKPDLVVPFVNRCHLRESTIHNIIYATHSWGNSIRHLFGIPSEAALIVENLVIRRYSTISSTQTSDNDKPLSTSAAENFAGEKDPTKLYAEFVRRYTIAYDSQKITDSWSAMRWMIAEGECDWSTVVQYAKNHPTSRTSIVYKDMMNPMTELHGDIKSIPNTDERPLSNS